MEINLFQKNFANREIKLKPMILVISIFIILIALIIIFNNDFYNYYSGKAIYTGNNKISTLVYIDDLEKITNSKKIILERTTFSYTVDSIDSEDFIYGDSIFKRVNLLIDDDDFNNIVNNYLNYDIILGHDTIINYFFKSLKGE